MAKKTTFVWILLVLIAITVLSSIYGILQGAVIAAALSTGPGIAGIVVNAVTVVLGTIYFFKLYKVRSDIERWTHIVFGIQVALAIVSFGMLFFFRNLTNALDATAIPFVITISMWIGITRHLARARRENLMEFS